MKSFFGGSVAIAAVLLLVSLSSNARPLFAETLLAQPAASHTQEQEIKTTTAANEQQQEQNKTLASSDHAAKASTVETNSAPLSAPQIYNATAYSRPGRGASGMGVRAGTIAADPRVLPFGTRVRLDAGQYSGEYVVTDSGSAIKGRKIDIWFPAFREACRFGRRNVKLTVLSYGGRRRTK